jgi:hypothetical protein
LAPRLKIFNGRQFHRFFTAWPGEIVFQESVSLAALLAEVEAGGYTAAVNYLTKQEQLVLCIVLGLLLTGWAVKTYRAAHPPAAVAAQPAKP